MNKFTYEGVDLIIVSSECGDWYGLYVNEKLEKEGHSIGDNDWINLIIKYKHFSGNIDKFEVSDDFCEELGSFPEKFEEIPKNFLK